MYDFASTVGCWGTNWTNFILSHYAAQTSAGWRRGMYTWYGAFFSIVEPHTVKCLLPAPRRIDIFDTAGQDDFSYVFCVHYFVWFFYFFVFLLFVYSSSLCLFIVIVFYLWFLPDMALPIYLFTDLFFSPSLFRAIRDQYYRTGDGFVCVYAITLQSSFEDVTEFHDAILRVKDCDSIPFVLVGVCLMKRNPSPFISALLSPLFYFYL